MSTRRLDRLQDHFGEIIETRERSKRETKRFEKYRDRPIEFIREVLGDEPWDRQEEIALAVRDHPLVTVRSCNSLGKDWLAARLGLWWYATRPESMVLVTGPTDRQVREVVFGEIRRAFNKSDLGGELWTTALRGPGERLILGFTSTEASRMTGLHAAGGILALMTEGQGVESFAYEALLSCATGENDRLLVVGNPLSPEGEFFRIHRPSSAWKKFKLAATEHPNVREGRVVIPGAVTRAFVERIESEFGRESPQYLSRVSAEFPEDLEFGLATRAWLEAAFERAEGTTLRYPNGVEVTL